MNKITTSEIKNVYDEFGIDIHSQTSQTQVNELVKEIIKLRMKLKGTKNVK